MADVKYSDAIAYLFSTFPELQSTFERRAKELYGEGLPDIVYGSVFVEYLNSLADELGGTTHAVSDESLRKGFRLIEELSDSTDFETVCLAEVSVIEGLLGDKGGLERFAPLMGPKTRQLARRVAEAFGLETDQLS
jgi:hypothetical protein